MALLKIRFIGVLQASERMSIVEIIIKQISSLHKVRKTAKQDFTEIQNKTALAGERFSYQLYLKAERPLFASVSVESELSENIRIYCVKDAVMDTPVVGDTPIEDYITQEPGLMPDILVPIEESGSRLSVDEIPRALWVKVDIPANTKPGRYSVCVNLCFVHPGNDPVGDYCQRMDIEVLPVVMPEQKLIYTRWIYLDCIAQVHGAQIFSEHHWDLIDQYIAAADGGNRTCLQKDCQISTCNIPRRRNVSRKNLLCVCIQSICF